MYGAADVQVGVRLQQAFRTLSRIGTPEMHAAVQEQSLLALARSRAALSLAVDVQRLEAIAAEVGDESDRLVAQEGRSAFGR